MTIPVRVRSFLQESQIPYSLCLHRPVYSAQEEAALLHIPEQKVAKTVVLRVGDQPYLAVLPAGHHINLKKLTDMLGAPAQLANEQEFARLFPDCETGAMPPFGSLYSLPVLLDQSLAQNDEIVFNAGTHTDTVGMDFRDFVSLADARICPFAEKNSHSGNGHSSSPEIAGVNIHEPTDIRDEFTESLRALQESSDMPLWQLEISELAGHNIEARGRDQVNRMLHEGWKLLHIYTLRYDDDGVWRERPMAILGKPRQGGKSKP